MTRLLMLLIATVYGTLLFADYDLPLVKGWGRVFDPDRDCQVQLDEDRLSIKFGPGSHALDAENGRMNSPRVLQPVDEDFSIQVTIDGNLPLPKPDAVKGTAYISGGLVLFQDNENYIRFERASFTRNNNIWHYANFEQRIDSRRTRMGLFADFPLQNDKPVQMRLEVDGDKVRALVRHVGDDWHELGVARLMNRGKIMAGVSGVKTDAGEATVSFRDLELKENLIAAEAKSESEIDLNEIRRIVRIPNLENARWKVLIQQIEGIHARAQKVGELSEAEQSQLIDEAKRLGTRKTPKLKAYLGPSIARRLAGNFVDAGMPAKAIKVYREFADALEQLREDGLKSSIESLRDSAERLEKSKQGKGE